MLFSLLSGVSGFATGAMSLILIRALMGVMEGSYCPTSFAATNEASAPSRRGFNQGLQQCTFALFGLGFAPIVATQLLRVVPSWRYVFIVAAVPGLILAVLLHMVLREPRHIARRRDHRAAPYGRIFHNQEYSARHGGAVLRHVRRIRVERDAAELSRGLPEAERRADGLRHVGVGLRRIHRPVCPAGAVGHSGPASGGGDGIRGDEPCSIWVLTRTGANPALLFGMLFFISTGCLGLVALITGPISTESAPVGLVSSAIGMVVGAGEIFGGGVAPSVAGFIAQHYGIQNILNLALGGVVCGILVCLFLKETAPRKGSRAKAIASTENAAAWADRCVRRGVKSPSANQLRSCHWRGYRSESISGGRCRSASHTDKLAEDKRLKNAARDPYVYPEYQPDPHLKTLEEIRDCLRDIRSALYRIEDRGMVNLGAGAIDPPSRTR